MTKDVNVNQLVINTLTKAQYDAALANDQISDTELYMITDDNVESYSKTESDQKYATKTELSDYVQTSTLTTTLADYALSSEIPTTVAELTDASDYATVASLATVATSGSYNDLSNKPTIPTVNNATLTIKRNNTTVDTFTANASEDKAINISVPTTVAELTDASDYATTASLATVATSGSYNDLSNKPTIPTVDQTYDGTSTNAQSGVAVKSAIDAAVSSAYKAAGSVAFASLPALSSANEGKVYNVTDSFTTTADFVEGAGKSYPAGTNVVVVNTSGTTYKYDVLAGFVDLSGYQLANTAVTHTASTAAGSATQPVYINASGVATPVSYELNKTVPADAVFTDTTYSAFSGSDGTNAGAAGLVPAPAAADNEKFLKGDGTWATVADSDTKNTAGSTDTSSKIYLVGATTQDANPQTYSHDTAFVDTDGRLNSAAPAANANDTTVATTKWVKDQGYKTSSGVTSVAEGSANGTVAVSVDGGTATNVSVHGLGTAAYTSADAYATAAQGALADTAVQSVAEGSANGTISVDGSNVAVHGLGSAAYTASTAYAAASHTHTTADVTLLTSYSKGSSSAALAATDTLNQALSKLENQIDSKASVVFRDWSQS